MVVKAIIFFYTYEKEIPIMKITYYGHSCFLVEENNSRILFDPYEDGSVPGFTLPKDIRVDAVYCSHEHADHNAAHLVHSENKEPFPKELIIVPHDHHDEKKRGMNRITVLNIHGIRLAHLGDIGRLPTKEEYEELKVDILLIPCGGHYTINSIEAKEIIETVNAGLTILMHYRNGNQGYDVLEDIHDIMQNTIPSIKQIASSTLDINQHLLDSHSIITLLPKQ